MVSNLQTGCNRVRIERGSYNYNITRNSLGNADDETQGQMTNWQRTEGHGAIYIHTQGIYTQANKTQVEHQAGAGNHRCRKEETDRNRDINEHENTHEYKEKEVNK